MIVFLIFLFYYNFVFARTAAVVSIDAIKQKTITVIFQNGNKLEVKTPSIVIPLLKEGHIYEVSIYRNKLRDPFLHKIKEIKS